MITREEVEIKWKGAGETFYEENETIKKLANQGKISDNLSFYFTYLIVIKSYGRMAKVHMEAGDYVGAENWILRGRGKLDGVRILLAGIKESEESPGVKAQKMIDFVNGPKLRLYNLAKSQYEGYFNELQKIYQSQMEVAKGN